MFGDSRQDSSQRDQPGSVSNLDPSCAASNALRDALRDMCMALSALNDEQYTYIPEGATGSIGGHVRHCLDHVQAMLAAWSGAELDYDNRRRGTPVEMSRGAAIHGIAELQTRMSQTARPHPDRPLTISVMVNTEATGCLRLQSTAGRELAYVLSHTIHHSAMIADMMRRMGATVPDRFGYAPATLAFVQAEACVR